MASKIPFWETREFRWLVIVLVLAVALLIVLFFEIFPLMEERAEREAARSRGAAEAVLPADEAFVKDPADPRWSGMLAGVEDWTAIETESPQYHALVQYVSKASPEALAKEARPVDFALLLRAAAALRGRTLSVKAVFLDSRVIALDKKAGDVEFVYRAYLIDPSAREGYVVDFVKPFPQIEKRVTVGTEALLFKLGTYEGKEGVKAAAHLVGRDLRALPNEPALKLEDDSSWILLLAAATALCLLVWTAFIFLHSRQRRRASPPPAKPAAK